MKYTTTTRPGKRKYSVIIPCDRMGLRMKSFGSRSLIKLKDDVRVIDNQLKIINDTFQNNEIILVTGFEDHRVIANTPDNVKYIHNESHSTTNISHSVKLGLEKATTEHIVVINGDLVFNPATLFTSFSNSTVLVSHDLEEKGSVGCTSNHNVLEHMIYDVPNKWSQIAYFTGRELSLLKELVGQEKHKMFFMFEIINMIVGLGGVFSTTNPKGMEIVGINSSKSIHGARTVYENSINSTKK